ncbi:unnamed protein product [Brassica rapa]|uniref:Secreted protein n=1 Tax=Brassica campestris TaxID=3711 RepID=A0A8D9CVD4_BRACM|nr:unnamed protein product [Brassica rapa]
MSLALSMANHLLLYWCRFFLRRRPSYCLLSLLLSCWRFRCSDFCSVTSTVYLSWRPVPVCLVDDRRVVPVVTSSP